MYSTIIFVVATLTLFQVKRVVGGCRMQDRNPCETVCQWNLTRKDYDCTLRAVVILPRMDKVEASLSRVCHIPIFIFYFSFFFA